MKGVLLFVLLALVFSQPPLFNSEERARRREKFNKEMADCILKADSISAELKTQIENNKDDDLRKVLHLYKSKLDTNDREIIRNCRREMFSKMIGMHRDGFRNHRFNNTFPFHGRRDRRENFP